jgi:hypothetical protein
MSDALVIHHGVAGFAGAGGWMRIGDARPVSRMQRSAEAVTMGKAVRVSARMLAKGISDSNSHTDSSTVARGMVIFAGGAGGLEAAEHKGLGQDGM